MSYEIPREVFKQKLLDRTNVCLLQAVGVDSHQEVPYKDIKTLQFPVDKDVFYKNFENKNLTYIVYGFDQYAAEAKKAAESIHSFGYPFVYYYLGNLSQDKILDKGIN